MARLPRPHIPIEAKCRVALRQIGEKCPDSVIEKNHRKLRLLLNESLNRLSSALGCTVDELRLDHNPALAVRDKVRNRAGDIVEYIPGASNPDFLVYRSVHAHHIKTNVRGDGAQFPDRVLIKRERRRDRPPRRKVKIKGRSQWPKRPLPKRSKDR